MTKKREEITFCPANRQEWRNWLEKHHDSAPGVWLICYKKNSTMQNLAHSEAVEEALCFGWIDSTRKSLDNEKFLQSFSKRKAKSVWSRLSKESVQSLIDKGLMTKAGLDSIDIAKQNGFWTILDDVEDLKIPDDLTAKFKTQPQSEAYFQSLSKSVKKRILQWLVLAKRPETRQKRIDEIVEHAQHQRRPEQFR